MCHRADHPRGSPARKLRVGVQCDDVADSVQNLQRACFEREAIVLTQQKFVEIEQLSALALPSHPNTLAGVEGAMTMKEKKRSSVLVAILCVQIVDAPYGEFRQRIGALVQLPYSRIRKIGKKTKVDIRVLIGEIASLEFVEQLLNLCLVEQQGWDNDESARFWRSCFRKIELGKRVRLHQGGDHVVHQINRALGRRYQRQQERRHNRP